jgi:iron complex transport system substrate-binding protein
VKELLFAVCGALLAGGALAAITVTDDAGRAVTLARPAQRIVALAPNLVEQLYAIGAGARIVAATEFADHPPAARALPRVARAHSVDLERVAAARPDLIVLWGSGFPPAVRAALEQLGVPVFVAEPARLGDVATSMERLGMLTAAPTAAAAAAHWRERLNALRLSYAGRAPVRVFYQVWAAPLMTLSGRHIVSEAIRLCGGVNIFDALAPLVPQVSAEAVLAADPQLIVTAEPAARASDALDPWRRYPQIAAVRAGQLATLDADKINRAAPRMAEEIEVLCRRIDAARRSTAAPTRSPRLLFAQQNAPPRILRQRHPGQIGDTRVDADLLEQRRHLSAVMSAVVEHLQHA